MCHSVDYDPVRSESGEVTVQQGSAEFKEMVKELEKSFKLSPEVKEKIERMEIKYHQRISLTRPFDEPGHKWTTYIVAMIAGLDRERSYKLSYFSQFPDERDKIRVRRSRFFILTLNTENK